MSSIGKRFPTAKGTGNIRSIINKNKGKENTKNKRIYTSEQRSRFGEAFLPYANRLESVEDNMIKRVLFFNGGSTMAGVLTKCRHVKGCA